MLRGLAWSSANLTSKVRNDELIGLKLGTSTAYKSLKMTRNEIYLYNQNDQQIMCVCCPYAVGPGGGSEQVDIVTHGASFFGGAVPGTFSALISTGIACPVPKPKALCPRTAHH